MSEVCQQRSPCPSARGYRVLDCSQPRPVVEGQVRGRHRSAVGKCAFPGPRARHEAPRSCRSRPRRLLEVDVPVGGHHRRSTIDGDRQRVVSGIVLVVGDRIRARVRGTDVRRPIAALREPDPVWSAAITPLTPQTTPMANASTPAAPDRFRIGFLIRRRSRLIVPLQKVVYEFADTVRVRPTRMSGSFRSARSREWRCTRRTKSMPVTSAIPHQ